MKIYISGGMSGYPELNYPEFDRVEEELKAQGYAVVNPATTGREARIPEGLTEDELYSFYLKITLRAMLECDTIYLLEDWYKSNGANFEYATAIKLKYKVMFQ
jgi:hypothetical protein